MKIVLIALYDIRSFGVRILHSVLKDAGFDPISIFFHENMEIDNYYSEIEIDLLIEKLKTLNPDLVAFGVRSPLFQLYKKIYHRIKNELNTTVMMGGHHPTVSPEECINYSDIVCIGEGERPLLELCNKLNNNESIDGIKNLWIQRNKELIKNKLRPLVENLDEIPYPSFSDTNQFYIQNNQISINGLRNNSKTTASVITSRGCFFQCSFCYNSTLKMIYKKTGAKYVRRRSVMNVINEIHMLKKVFPLLSEIYFSDNIFTYNKKWINEFCSIYSKEIKLPFGCFGHFSFIDPEMLQKLKDAGLYRITAGIQSGSDILNKEILNRKVSKKQIIKGSKILSKLGIDIYYDLITNNPYETYKTQEETLDLLLQLEKPFNLRNFKMKYYPKVPLTQRLLTDGYINDSDIESNHEKSFELWKETIDLSESKSKMALFWDCIYFMVSIGLPRSIILQLSNSDTLRKHPKFLGLPLKLYSHTLLARKSLKFILRGDFKFVIKSYLQLRKRKKEKEAGWGY